MPPDLSRSGGRASSDPALTRLAGPGARDTIQPMRLVELARITRLTREESKAPMAADPAVRAGVNHGVLRVSLRAMTVSDAARKDGSLLANSGICRGAVSPARSRPKRCPGAWVRPVSERPAEEASEHERQYEDGSDPRVLDIMDVPLKAAPSQGLPVGELVARPGYYWKRAVASNLGRLDALADDPAGLANGFSTGSGAHDRVGPSDAACWAALLVPAVFRPAQATAVCARHEFREPERRVQAEFSRWGIKVPPVGDNTSCRAEVPGRHATANTRSESAFDGSLGEPHKGIATSSSPP